MKYQRLKLSFRGVSPMIWRRVELSEETSLAELHYIIQSCYRWDDFNLHHFRIHGKDFGISRACSMHFHKDAYKITVGDFEFDEGDKYWYAYNYNEYWTIDIRVEKIFEKSRHKIPRCIGGKGMFGVTFDDEYEFLTKSAGFIQELLENDGQLDADLQQELKECCELSEDVSFNRKMINDEITQLHEEMSR